MYRLIGLCALILFCGCSKRNPLYHMGSTGFGMSEKVSAQGAYRFHPEYEEKTLRIKRLKAGKESVLKVLPLAGVSELSWRYSVQDGVRCYDFVLPDGKGGETTLLKVRVKGVTGIKSYNAAQLHSEKHGGKPFVPHVYELLVMTRSTGDDVFGPYEFHELLEATKKYSDAEIYILVVE